MIAKIEVNGVHYKIPEDVARYARKKIGGLDGMMSAHTKKSAHAEIKIKEASRKNNEHFACEVVMYLPNGQIAAEGKGKTVHEAIDFAEHKLSTQLRRYKEKNQPSKRREVWRRATRRIKGFGRSE